MQARIPKSAALAALMALLAPAGPGHDEAPGLPTVTTALSPLPKSPTPDLTSLKTIKPAKAVDEAFREKDVWGRIRSGYAIPDVNNELVAKHVNWYATRPTTSPAPPRALRCTCSTW
jgi:membrane-bound lytic murein transglycosylase D